MLYALRLSQVVQHRTNIGVEQNGLHFKSSHGDGLALVDAGVGGPGILSCHAQKWHFDDAGGVAADAEFQEQYAAIHMPMQEILIPSSRSVPALILHKGIVTAQVHGHGLAALEYSARD